MYHAHNEKWENTNNGWNRTTKSVKNQNVWRKGKLQELGITRSEHYKKAEYFKKRVFQTNEESSRDQALQQKSHQKN